MYRGQDIGGREQLIKTCLEILRQGSSEQLYEILPHIGVTRSPLFLKPLLNLLRSRDRSKKQFAALALGSLGSAEALRPLYEVFQRKENLSGSGSQSLQTAAIVAMGEIGDERAVEYLLKLFRLEIRQDRFRPQRQHLVLASLGALAQQGCAKAEQALMDLMREHPEGRIRAQALSELGVSYWHRARSIPQPLLEEIFKLAFHGSQEIRQAAHHTLTNLADLGCEAAQRMLKKSRS